MTADPAITAWLDRQVPVSETALAACVSAVDLVKERPAFGQRIVPAPGSVLASPVADTAAGEPDYFFHWLRDGALVFDAARPLARTGRGGWVRAFDDYIGFSLGLDALDGRRLAADDRWRDAAAPAVAHLLRPPAELAAVWGEAVPGDVRFGPDGSLDTIHWSRPQHDGPALEALVCMRYLAEGLGGEADIARLIRRNLDYTLTHETSDGVDIWEEQAGDHFYTRLLQFAALRAGARWHQAEAPLVARCTQTADRLERHLDAFWSPDEATYATRLASAAGPPDKQIDVSTLLALLHAGIEDGPLAVTGDRALATLERLEAAFAVYPLNREHAPTSGPALGRYIGDVYVTRGPWYLATFAAAELRYRRAAVAGPQEAAALVARGDRTLALARITIPASGALTEQFDPVSGAQTSARDLGWSHAALLTMAAARAAVV